mgnify:CR=1 FL=1
MNALHPWLLVAVGGALGAVLRYGAAAAINRWAQSLFPFGTLAVNVLGCLLIGYVMMSLPRTGEWRESLRLLLVTGMLGGFTTFSSFSWETVGLIEEGRVAYALGNVALSLALCLLATFAGIWLARH